MWHVLRFSPARYTERIVHSTWICQRRQNDSSTRVLFRSPVEDDVDVNCAITGARQWEVSLRLVRPVRVMF